MENFKTPGLHRFSWLGKPYMHKKQLINLIQTSISNKTYKYTGYKKLTEELKFFIDTFFETTPCTVVNYVVVAYPRNHEISKKLYWAYIYEGLSTCMQTFK